MACATLCGKALRKVRHSYDNLAFSLLSAREKKDTTDHRSPITEHQKKVIGDRQGDR
jgi:hypothetical protein